jgi:hypothetical protein
MAPKVPPRSQMLENIAGITGTIREGAQTTTKSSGRRTNKVLMYGANS